MMTRRDFLETGAAAAAAHAPAVPPLDSVRIAGRHAIVRDLPTPGFFEGMLLGNGDIGVCVVCRPDALGLHIGKLDVWDIRVSADHIRHLRKFPEVMELWRRASERAKQEGRPEAIHLETADEEFREYVAKVRSSYAKPWPRPWPCGTVWLHWDSRRVRVVRQRLDIATGVYRLEVERNDLRGPRAAEYLECFVGRDSGYISVAGTLPIDSAAYIPHVDAATRMPPPEAASRGPGRFSCEQRLPATPPFEDDEGPAGPSPEDRRFAIAGGFEGTWAVGETDREHRSVRLRLLSPHPTRLDIALYTSLEEADPALRAASEVKQRADRPVAASREESVRAWAEFWRRSAVEFTDRELERIWYHNQYFLACCLREGKVAPGLFGNWSTGNIGTAWHGDYHMNYNTQQVFWGVFSSNHVEQHLPYVRLVEDLMPMAEWNAREQFGLPGAYFPHSAYPVPSPVNPYPVPPWGYEICETPWTVQSLWWHYLFTLDGEYLERVYPLLRAATDFLAAYARRGDDGKYHLNPTVSPENWGFTVDQRLNRDCIIDIALAEFLLDAMADASRRLGRDADLRERWIEMRRNLAPYPEADGPYGRVWTDVAGGPAEHVYNVPVTAAPVFPAEQVGLDRRQELLPIARRTIETIRLEGGNDLVWQPLMRARLGLLDLAWFKREVAYCLLPNGVANDRVRQTGGRYSDRTDFDFMMRMGVWTENLALPAVLNECLLQSCAGVIRLFPNTANLGRARFRDLRAAGAFLVSAAWDGRQVRDVTIRSERGATARVVSPWAAASVLGPAGPVEVRRDGRILEFDTVAGEEYRLAPAAGAAPSRRR